MTQLAPGGPALAAVLVVGGLRQRGQGALDALCAQTALDRMEIVVVDIGPESAPPLRLAEQAPITSIRASRQIGWGAARLAGLNLVSAPAVAFIEDHCHPEPGWAEALIEAHEGPWAAVGYGFKNANPQTYASRSTMVGDYGLWMLPTVRGPAGLLACNNISYKRARLLELGDKLPDAMSNDIVAQETFWASGLQMFTESRAVVAHENFDSVLQNGRASFAFGRAMASRRAQALEWSMARRLVWGLLTPLGEPIVRLARVLRTVPARPPLGRRLLAALPVLAVVTFFGSTGQGLGYLLGSGASEEVTLSWELEIDRRR